MRRRLPARSPCTAQAFAAPDRVAELVGRVREALQGALPEAVARMRLYLPNSATHAILLKPVKSNVAEAHGQVRGRLCEGWQASAGPLGGRGAGAGCSSRVPPHRA